MPSSRRTQLPTCRLPKPSTWTSSYVPAGRPRPSPAARFSPSSARVGSSNAGRRQDREIQRPSGARRSSTPPRLADATTRVPGDAVDRLCDVVRRRRREHGHRGRVEGDVEVRAGVDVDPQLPGGVGRRRRRGRPSRRRTRCPGAERACCPDAGRPRAGRELGVVAHARRTARCPTSRPPRRRGSRAPTRSVAFPLRSTNVTRAVAAPAPTTRRSTPRWPPLPNRPWTAYAPV